MYVWKMMYIVTGPKTRVTVQNRRNKYYYEINRNTYEIIWLGVKMGQLIFFQQEYEMRKND